MERRTEQTARDDQAILSAVGVVKKVAVFVCPSANAVVQGIVAAGSVVEPEKFVESSVVVAGMTAVAVVGGLAVTGASDAWLMSQ